MLPGLPAPDAPKAPRPPSAQLPLLSARSTEQYAEGELAHLVGQEGLLPPIPREDSPDEGARASGEGPGEGAASGGNTVRFGSDGDGDDEDECEAASSDGSV